MAKVGGNGSFGSLDVLLINKISTNNSGLTGWQYLEFVGEILHRLSFQVMQIK